LEIKINEKINIIFKILNCSNKKFKNECGLSENLNLNDDDIWLENMFSNHEEESKNKFNFKTKNDILDYENTLKDENKNTVLIDNNSENCYVSI